MTIIFCHLFVNFYDILQRCRYLCASKIGLKILYLIYRFLYNLILIFHTFLKHSFELTSKTNNIKFTILRQRFNKKYQCVTCLLYPFTLHRAWSIKDEYVLTDILIEVRVRFCIGFLLWGIESYTCTFICQGDERLLRVIALECEN